MMSRRTSQKMLNQQVVTKLQLREAAKRQRLHGGRLGQSLVALGYISEDQLATFFKRTPPAPATIEKTGLDLQFIADLALKHLIGMGEFRLSDLSRSMGLPSAILDEAIALLRREKMVEVRGASQFVKSSFNFIATDTGKKHGSALMDICRYAGPAPVTLEDYREMVENQSIRNISINDDVVRAAFSEIVIGEQMLNRLGPAICSGAPMFIYGPPGNGKTTIAETLSRVLGGEVFVPHALEVDGQIIKVFDPMVHLEVSLDDLDSAAVPRGDIDRRWLLSRRPTVIAGGELTLETLDLIWNASAKYYEAPFQVKANGGMLLIDDFGRQRVHPTDLLNRWIVPLEKHVDFLTLHTGKKFEVPFDELVVFSTNLDPKELVDEAFLRRIKYKIEVKNPTEQDYREIFRRLCERDGVPYNDAAVDYIVDTYYRAVNMELRACHPRDILQLLQDAARFRGKRAVLSQDLLDHACRSFFVVL